MQNLMTAADINSEDGQSHKNLSVTTIERKNNFAIDWLELWNYRELLYFLVWRDIKVRYKQTSLGIAWAVLQPLMGTFIFTVIFGHLAKMPSEGHPYQVFVLAGLIPWTFFANGVSQSALSLVGQQNLITKVYFPRLFLPAAAVVTGLIDLCISFVLYAAVLLWFREPLTINILALPAVIFLNTLVALGVGVGLAALTVLYRDFRYVIPFSMQLWMYASPVVYPASLVPERFKWVFAMNPMTGVIDAYRSTLLGRPWDLTTLSISMAIGVVVLIFGLSYFKKTERIFADIA